MLNERGGDGVLTNVRSPLERAASATDARPAVAEPDRALAGELADRFVHWLDGFGEHSHDPYDFWSWGPGRKAKRFYYRHAFAGPLAALPFVALDTLWPRSRRFVGDPRRYPIADAHYASAFFRRAQQSGDARELERGRHFLDELLRSRSPGFDELCWGYPFVWESRSGTIEAGTPLVTTVPYAYEAFEAGYEATQDVECLNAMQSIATFAYARIPVTDFGDGSAAAGYTPALPTTVVNASCYRAFLLAAAGRRFERSDWSAEAERNVAFALALQRPDGSWPYATTEGDEFVDNMHTCFVLKNLFKYSLISGRADVRDAVHRGYDFYRRTLLDEDLQPIPFAVKPRITLHRGDLYDYAEGILLASQLRDADSHAPVVLRGLLRGLADRWTRPAGNFVTRRLVIGQNTVPYHRWAQSQAFHALVHVASSGG